jgi:erythronate-4-phosphate dehydrogenase
LEKLRVLFDKNILLLEKSLGDICILQPYSTKDNVKELINEFNPDVLLIRSTVKVNEELVNDTNIKFIATATSGSDHIDKEYLDSKGILHFDAIGCNSNSVAEYVLFSILHLVDRSKVGELKLGLLGVGSIGGKVLEYCLGIGFKTDNIYIHDPYKIEELKDKGFHHVDVEDLIHKVDILTNHIPLNEETKDYLNREHLELLKDDCVVVHTSRGGIIDEDALFEIQKRKNLKLAIDVWKEEPYIDHKHLEISNITTPHIAGHTIEGKILGTKTLLDHLKEVYNLNYSPIFLLEELHKSAKKQISDFTIESLYEQLKESRCLDFETDDFKKNYQIYSTREESISYFKHFRENYPVRREVLKWRGI